MRLTAIPLLLLSLTGCGGYVVLDSRSGGSAPPPQPRTIPAPAPRCEEISRHQAADIALAEASRQHCRFLQVRDVDGSRHHWTVELVAGSGHHDRVEIRVKVDRRSGEILSYKEKVGKRKHDKHDDHHDDD